MKGYKAMNSGMTCRGFKFEVGKRYKHDGELSICNSGFHFCKCASDVFEYYDFDLEKTIVCEIIAHGKVLSDGNKSVTDEIEIVRVIQNEELLKLINTGDYNTGRCNTGNWNRGDCNTGNNNTGNYNTGNNNTGNNNTGEMNTGRCNAGRRNAGDYNTGRCNTGDYNTGDWNTGDWNTGNWNIGDRNIGDYNTGDWNTGDWNTGNWNIGDSNTGDLNTGNRNIGDYNTGDWNTGNWNTGFFNTKTPDTILVFGKETTRDVWINSYKPRFLFFNLTEWICYDEMTENEKQKNQSAKTTSGYLKQYDYKESFIKSWENSDHEDRMRIKELPNFDYDIFYEISGIDVRKYEKE
jgi:hypothetical protein